MFYLFVCMIKFRKQAKPRNCFDDRIVDGYEAIDNAVDAPNKAKVVRGCNACMCVTVRNAHFLLIKRKTLGQVMSGHRS